jgi:hypothetical protein
MRSEIVGVWNARQAGGRALWFDPTIAAAIAPASRGSPTRARPAANVARSTFARSTGIRADRYQASSRQCLAGDAARTPRSPSWKC